MRVELGAGLTQTLPMLDLGKGPLKLAVVAGIHGDEGSPVRAVHALWRALAGHTLTGRLRLIGGAHAAALAATQRLSPLDGQDLNRIHGGALGATPTARLSRALVTALKGVPLVINLHDFEMPTPLVGIWPGVYDAARQERHARWMELLGPRMVWQFGPEEDALFLQSIDRLLEERGVDVLAVEMGPSWSDPGDALLQGLLRLVHGVGLCPELTVAPTGDTRRVHRHLCPSPEAGFFEPMVELGQPVEAGQPLGQLLELVPGHARLVPSPRDGVVFSLRRPQLVRAGQSVAALGLRC